VADIQNGQMMKEGDDSRLLSRFYKQAVKNEHKSTAEGRPVFDEVVFVSIIIPGDKHTKVERKARDEDKERFPNAWARFQNNETAATSGTPLEEWPRVSVSQVAELKAMNIMTVEHIAGLSDSICQKMMGLDRLRTEAKAYIAAAKDQAHAQKLAAELEQRDEKIASLQETVATLAAKLDALSDKPKREKAAA
jgi:predicted phage-related endonuclease